MENFYKEIAMHSVHTWELRNWIDFKIAGIEKGQNY